MIEVWNWEKKRKRIPISFDVHFSPFNFTLRIYFRTDYSFGEEENVKREKEKQSFAEILLLLDYRPPTHSSVYVQDNSK